MMDRDIKVTALKRIARSQQLAKQIKELSAPAQAERYETTYDVIRRVRKGQGVRYDRLTQEEQSKIRRDLRRSEELKKLYETLDDIAIDMGISRRTLSAWRVKKKHIQYAPRREISESDHAMVPEFLVMRLTSNPCGPCGYY